MGRASERKKTPEYQAERLQRGERRNGRRKRRIGQKIAEARARALGEELRRRYEQTQDPRDFRG